MGLDTSTPSGRLMLNVFVSVAQFERELMLERQLEGVAKAKAEGRYKGRAPTAQRKADKVVMLASDGVQRERRRWRHTPRRRLPAGLHGARRGAFSSGQDRARRPDPAPAAANLKAGGKPPRRISKTWGVPSGRPFSWAALVLAWPSGGGRVSSPS